MSIRVCIDAANLKVGGGVQVAVSFIDELTRLDLDDLDVVIIVSSEVERNLKRIAVDLSQFKKVVVMDSGGIKGFRPSCIREFVGFDVIFTIFGPKLVMSRKGKNIVGFAQPWVIYPNNECLIQLGLLGRLKRRIVIGLQAFFFKRASTLVVELEHVKEGLVREGISDGDNVRIVHNCVSRIYSEPGLWAPVNFERGLGTFSIGFLGRDYPHKNTNILPRIKAVLRSRYSIEADFYVTFTEREWAAKSAEFRASVINVGSLTVNQCPSFYQHLDAVIFPSFLECFSATPLEAMMMEKMLFASDRRFVRDVCGDFAYYFEPSDANSAAAVIAQYIGRSGPSVREALCAAKEHACSFSNATHRANAYLSIIREVTSCA